MREYVVSSPYHKLFQGKSKIMEVLGDRIRVERNSPHRGSENDLEGVFRVTEGRDGQTSHNYCFGLG